MATELQSVRRRILRKLAMSLPIIIAVLLALPSDSRADAWQGGHGHGHGQRVRAYAPHYSTVPRWIPVESRSTFRPYFSGRVYYGPHHHYHTAYQFPVFVNGVVAYRPYYYCGDQVFVSTAFPLPRLAFGVVLGTPPPVVGYPWFPAGGYFYFHHESRGDDDD